MLSKNIPNLGSEITTQMYQCALKNYPNEACGLLVQTTEKKYRFVEARNRSENPEATFVMHDADVLKAEDLGDVVAIWHSHTDCSNEASDADKAGCEATGVPWFILSITRNFDEDIEAEYRFSDMNVITPNGFAMPYLGRPYVFGVFDCWMLCRDYLKREFDVSLNANLHLHVPGWYVLTYDILGENYKNEGLVRLQPGSEPMNGDIFFMQYGRMPDHCAVYIGDGMIMHHQIDRLSCRTIYGGMYEKHTTHHLRHKDLLQGNEKCLS